MTLEQWITKYEEKAEKFERLPGFLIYFEPKKGFFCWKVTGDVFEIDHACTNDIQYINKIVNDMAKLRLCSLLRTSTCRNIAAYWRLQGRPNINWSLSGVRPNGDFYMVFERDVI